MRFVPVKSEAQQASGVEFRARDLLVRQRTQILNAIRGHLAEYGRIAPKGICYVERLVAEIEDPASELPEAARASLASLVALLRGSTARSPASTARSPGAPRRMRPPAG